MEAHRHQGSRPGDCRADGGGGRLQRQRRRCAVLEQAAANDAGETADTAGVILRCTVDDPGDSGFAPGQEVTVLLPASGEALPAHLRIAYVMEEAENTVTAVTWAEAETDEK